MSTPGVVVREVRDQNGNFNVQFYDDGSTNLTAVQTIAPAIVSELAASNNQLTMITTLGAPSDTAANNTSTSGSIISWLHGLYNKFPLSLGKTTSANSLPVVLPSDPDYRPGAGSITAVDIASTSVVGQNSVTVVEGSPTANSTLTWPTNGFSSGNFSFVGSFIGTYVIEGSYDTGNSWVGLTTRVRGSGYTTASITGPGSFLTDISGVTNVRVRATSITTGSPTITPSFSAAAGLTQILNPVKIFDNTSGAQATIKAANTVATANDTSLVVTTNPTTVGSTGTDYSFNKPTIPNIGANFANSGIYASYALVGTLAANTSRSKVEVQNISNTQIVIMRDDGTAAANTAPQKVSVFAVPIAGSWSSTTFKGRLQFYAASAFAAITVMVD